MPTLTRIRDYPNRGLPRCAPAVVRVLELIHDGRLYASGDLPSEIVDEVVLSLEGIESDFTARERSQRCGNCGATFVWPGELDHHLRTVHWGEAWKAAA